MKTSGLKIEHVEKRNHVVVYVDLIFFFRHGKNTVTHSHTVTMKVKKPSKRKILEGLKTKRP